MFKGMFSGIFQDLISKGLQMAGAIIAGSGVATGDQTTAIMGGLSALAGVLWNLYSNNKARQNTAIVTVANDSKLTTTQVIARPVGHDK
jgi:hypothetical protein